MKLHKVSFTLYCMYYIIAYLYCILHNQIVYRPDRHTTYWLSSLNNDIYNSCLHCLWLSTPPIDLLFILYIMLSLCIFYIYMHFGYCLHHFSKAIVWYGFYIWFPAHYIYLLSSFQLMESFGIHHLYCILFCSISNICSYFAWQLKTKIAIEAFLFLPTDLSHARKSYDWSNKATLFKVFLMRKRRNGASRTSLYQQNKCKHPSLYLSVIL